MKSKEGQKITFKSCLDLYFNVFIVGFCFFSKVTGLRLLLEGVRGWGRWGLVVLGGGEWVSWGVAVGGNYEDRLDDLANVPLKI